jgi:hypothetical protein
MVDVRINDKLFLVDDEPNVLAGYVRHLRKILNVDVAEGRPHVLALIAGQGPYAVVV